jgi:hypothetical protein
MDFSIDGQCKGTGWQSKVWLIPYTPTKQHVSSQTVQPASQTPNKVDLLLIRLNQPIIKF